MNKIVKISFDVISYIFVAILAIYVLNVLYFRIIKKDKIPRVFNYYIFNIKTGSMEDTIHVNDYIIVKKTKDVKENDIVTFKRDNAYITHRIIKIDGDKIITKGDANNVEDDPITKDAILGKYVKKASILGFILKNKLLCITLVILFCVVDMLLKSFKK